MSENPFATETIDDDIRLDATLVNVLTQMGTGGDRSEYTTVGRGARIQKQQLEDLYRVPICRRVVNARPNSATLKGWNLTLGSESDQKVVSKFAKYSDRLKLKNKFRTAQVQANIYGGAVLVIAANDGKDASYPLDEKKISTIDSLQVLDRYKIQPVLNLGVDPEDPEFYRLLLPEFLQRKFNEMFPSEGKDFLIHSSRIIRFDGVAYTSDMLWDNEGWGGSVLESLWEDYRDWKTSLKAIGAMVQDCSVFVYKLKGLAQMIKGQDENLLKSRLKLMRMMISVFGGFAADADGENIEFPSRNFGGIDQVANQLRDAFIGATGIPHDRLFGESPSGLGATGESEEKNWASDVASFQQTEWLPKLLDLGRKIFLAKDGPTGGKEPEDWSFEFPSLLQQSEADIASNRSTQASTDNTYLSTGVLLPEEVRASRFGGSKYSIETVLDNKLFAKKQKEAEAQQQQQFGDFGGEVPPEEELPPEEEVPEEEATNQDSVERYDALYSQLPKDEEGRVKYLGKWWHTNKPVKSDRQGKKRMVLAKKGDRVKLVHYGAEGYEHNYSESAKRNYLTRSAGIKDKNGKPTKDDPFSPNHWARKDLWNKKLPADGSTLYQGRSQEAEVRSEESKGKGKKCGDGYTSTKNECRTDASDRPRRIVGWNGLSIGITHEPGDTRFPLSRPMQSSYGHLRRSYGAASDGKAIDVYLGDRLESPQAYKVRQLDPKTGMPDEDKYFIGFEDAASARDCFNYHAGRDRFGGIELVDPNELQVYRQDNCSLGQPRLSTGVQTFNTKLFANGAPTSEEILRIVQATFPEEVLKLGDWKYKADGTADGEFYTPLGVYGFGIKNNYCGYAWRRELRADSDPVRPGYTWVNDRSVHGGGYFRKGEAQKKPEKQTEKSSSSSDFIPEFRNVQDIKVLGTDYLVQNNFTRSERNEEHELGLQGESFFVKDNVNKEAFIKLSPNPYNAISESVASSISESIDIPINKVSLLRNNSGSDHPLIADGMLATVHDVVAGETINKLAKKSQRFADIKLALDSPSIEADKLTNDVIKQHSDFAKIMAFDIYTRNRDFHSKNILFDESTNKAHGIDKGLAFGTPEHTKKFVNGFIKNEQSIFSNLAEDKKANLKMFVGTLEKLSLKYPPGKISQGQLSAQIKSGVYGSDFDVNKFQNQIKRRREDVEEYLKDGEDLEKISDILNANMQGLDKRPEMKASFIYARNFIQEKESYDEVQRLIVFCKQKRL